MQRRPAEAVVRAEQKILWSFFYILVHANDDALGDSPEHSVLVGDFPDIHRCRSPAQTVIGVHPASRICINLSPCIRLAFPRFIRENDFAKDFLIFLKESLAGICVSELFLLAQLQELTDNQPDMVCISRCLNILELAERNPLAIDLEDEKSLFPVDRKAADSPVFEVIRIELSLVWILLHGAFPTSTILGVSRAERAFASCFCMTFVGIDARNFIVSKEWEASLDAGVIEDFLSRFRDVAYNGHIPFKGLAGKNLMLF